MKKERRLQSRLIWTGEVVQFGRWLGGKISEGKRKAKRRKQWRQASKRYRARSPCAGCGCSLARCLAWQRAEKPERKEELGILSIRGNSCCPDCKHGQTVRAVSDLRAPRKISGLPPAPALNLNGEL